MLSLCIPTFRRPTLLRKLLEDVARQTTRPACVIVVDGDPASGHVLAVLDDMDGEVEWGTCYVASNHSNLAYQRYLGWRIAAEQACDELLYLDDDLRILQEDAIERTVAPLRWDHPFVVGVTGRLVFGEIEREQGGVASEARSPGNRWAKRLRDALASLGASARLPEGGISSTGNRRLPAIGSDEYVRTEWLHGGVMAFRASAVSEESFPDDLFALTSVGCGLGEDTVISRRIGARGVLMFAARATFRHPNADATRAYPTASFERGFATAYSRRYINDEYRVGARARVSDRLSLLRSYLGVAMLNLVEWLARPTRARGLFALGFAKGCIKGLVVPPESERLAPGVRWRSDATAALQKAIATGRGRGWGGRPRRG